MAPFFAVHIMAFAQSLWGERVRKRETALPLLKPLVLSDSDLTLTILFNLNYILEAFPPKQPH